MTSNGGVLLLRGADHLPGLTASLARRLSDDRQAGKVEHSLRDMLRQRIYSLPLGYEDLNDHDALRHDQALQTAADRDQPPASPSTLCRFENTADRQVARAAHEVLMETFIASFKHPPDDELVLDFDATDDAVHGHQEGRFFQAYYDHDCFLPLYVFCDVFCGNQLLVSYLRPSNIDGAKHAWAILALLVRRLRRVWPKVRIILRGDSGFCRHRMLDWCDRHDVDYVLGIARNARLNALAEPWLDRSARDFEASGEKQRLFGEFTYAAGTWRSERRVIARIEHSAKGANPRYIVTSLPGNAQALYEERYCARGEMENRIKEQQLDLFADRTSCHKWWPNQFRLLLSALACTLMEAIRRIGLTGTRMARARCGTIRLRLLKIGAIIQRNTRRVRFMMSSACPDEDLFRLVASRLVPD